MQCQDYLVDYTRTTVSETTCTSPVITEMKPTISGILSSRVFLHESVSDRLSLSLSYGVLIGL